MEDIQVAEFQRGSQEREGGEAAERALALVALSYDGNPTGARDKRHTSLCGE